MEEIEEKKRRIRWREQLFPDAKPAPKHKKPEDQDLYQINLTPGPYAKAGLYLAGAVVLIWASQYALAALASTIRQYKNVKRALKE